MSKKKPNYEELEIQVAELLHQIDQIKSVKFELALNESETKFKNIFEISIDAICVTKNGKIKFVNPATLLLFNCNDEKKLIDKKLIDFICSDSKTKFNEHIFNLENGIFVKPKIELNAIKFSGEIMDVEVQISEYFQNNEKYLIEIIRDVSEQKKYNQNLLKAIIDTEEKERLRVAVELHDGIGPLISAAKLYISTFISTSSNIDEKNSQILSKVNDILNEGINEIKRISSNLTPQILDKFGLQEAIRSFCQKINDSKKIHIEFIEDDLIIENKETQIAVYRIVNELINNSIKHSRAKNVNIRFTQNSVKSKKSIFLLYSDDGIGFNVDENINKQQGMGLSNIQSRVLAINGSCKFSSKPDVGMDFILKFPI